MAMRPFIGYNVGDYFQHWINMGGKIEKLPKIFHVNWFRKDEEGHFMWPGFGDNLRVLSWIADRCDGKVDARETELGYLPYAKDINIEGLDIDPAVLEELLSVDKEVWLNEVKLIKEFYAQFDTDGRFPKELYDQLAALEARLNK
jgi:phosphoenolpyruvate carboxykinase (GTP)